MSNFSNVISRIVDPVFDRTSGGNRVEFRLPADQVYLSGMRLINIGATATEATSYNPILGALCAIKQISLYDGGQVIDQLRLAPLLNSIKNLNVKNDQQLSMERYLKSVGLGFVASGAYAQTGTPKQIDANNPKIREQNNVADNKGTKSWVSLKDLLPFLGASMIVDTGLFRQFRLVIEYNSPEELKHFFKKTDATNRTAELGALLLVDEMAEGELKQTMMKDFRKGMIYRPLETDTVIVRATGAGADTAAESQIEDRQNFLVNGFNNKHLKRIMVVQQPTVQSTWDDANALVGYGNMSSSAQWRESVQFRVNGKDLLPGGGINSSDTGSSKNRRLAHLVDAWGDFDIPVGQNATSFAKKGAYYDTAEVQTVGQTDFTGVKIEEKIHELQVQFGRYGVYNNTSLKQQLNLVLVGEVVKAIVVNPDGTYVIQYI